MFEHLQKKWKVNGWRLLLILATFAIAGSLTGWLGKKLLSLAGIEIVWLFILLYIILIVLLWPIMVIMVSISLGQFSFFKNYLKKVFRWFGVRSQESGVGSSESGVGVLETTNPVRPGHPGGHKPQTPSDRVIRAGINHKPKNIAVFASGAGSNAQNLMNHFKNSPSIKVALICCNKHEAGVLQIAKKENTPVLMIEKEKFFRGNAYVDELKEKGIDLIVLAGFLWKLPEKLINEYRDRIINIHPALLPKYGGKGFYGEIVHQSVINAGEKETGITIHYVDEHYDNGDIILQVKCPVLENDTPQTLAQRVHALEYEYYPKVIEKILNG